MLLLHGYILRGLSLTWLSRSPLCFDVCSMFWKFAVTQHANGGWRWYIRWRSGETKSWLGGVWWLTATALLCSRLVTMLSTSGLLIRYSWFRVSNGVSSRERANLSRARLASTHMTISSTFCMQNSDSTASCRSSGSMGLLLLSTVHKKQTAVHYYCY